MTTQPNLTSTHSSTSSTFATTDFPGISPFSSSLPSPSLTLSSTIPFIPSSETSSSSTTSVAPMDTTTDGVPSVTGPQQHPPQLPLQPPVPVTPLSSSSSMSSSTSHGSINSNFNSINNNNNESKSAPIPDDDDWPELTINAPLHSILKHPYCIHYSAEEAEVWFSTYKMKPTTIEEKKEIIKDKHPDAIAINYNVPPGKGAKAAYHVLLSGKTAMEEALKKAEIRIGERPKLCVSSLPGCDECGLAYSPYHVEYAYLITNQRPGGNVEEHKQQFKSALQRLTPDI